MSVMFSDLLFPQEVFIKLQLDLAVSVFNAPTEKPD